MSFKIKKSRGFDKSFETVINTRNLAKLNKIAKIAGIRAGTLTPYDEGKLRNSLEFTPATKRTLQAVNTWSAMNKANTFNYAAYRYNYNDKNPHTTRWAEKDFKKFGIKDVKDMGGIISGRYI